MQGFKYLNIIRGPYFSNSNPNTQDSKEKI